MTPPAQRTRVIFIAGSSYSGSTILGLVLGASPRAHFAGEVNQYMRRHSPSKRQPTGHRVCTCGATYDRCGFWSAVHGRYGLDVDLNAAPGFSWQNFRLMLRILLPWARRRGLGSEAAYASLLGAVHEVATAADPRVTYIVDSSKSIQSLDALANAPRTELLVVHLIRSPAAVAASYKRRGYSAFHGLGSWALVNLFLWLYLRRRRIACLHLDYEAFCSPDGVGMARLNRFLGTALNRDEVAAQIRAHRYHLLGGNQDVLCSLGQVESIELRPARTVLNPIERVATALVTLPIERLRRPPRRRCSAPATAGRG
jgi:hypothetical protein